MCRWSRQQGLPSLTLPKNCVLGTSLKGVALKNPFIAAFAPGRFTRALRLPIRYWMARRRKSQETAIAQLIALGVVGFAFLPFLRDHLLLVLIVIVAALLAVVIYRLTNGPRRVEWASSTPQRSPFISVGNTTPLKEFVPTAAPARSVARTQPNNEMKALDWFQFEKLVGVLYAQQGYSVARSGGANPAGGIDLVVTKSDIATAIQCKHWKSWKVGVKQIREFLGALADRGIGKGIFVTLQEYTAEAKELASRHQIELIAERELTQMLETVNWRFNPAIIAIFDDPRKLCPRCESEMILRTANKGSNAGSQFWGCSSYPKCRFTLQQAGDIRAAR